MPGTNHNTIRAIHHAHELARHLRRMKKDEERLDVMDIINREFCKYCGSTDNPCYCMRDE